MNALVGTGRGREGNPVPPGALFGLGKDLRRVPVRQLWCQRHDPTVDLGSRALLTQFREHRNRRNRWGSTLWERLHITTRREYEDLASEQVQTVEFHQFLWLGRFLLPFQCLATPCQRLIRFAASRGTPFLFLLPPV